MKRKVAGLLAVFCLFAVSMISIGGCKKFMSGLKEGVDTADAFATGDVSKLSKKMFKYLLQANAELMEAIASIQEATGQKEKADVLRMKAKDLRENPQKYQTEEKIKEVFKVSNNAAREVQKMDLTSVEANEKASSKMNDAYVNLGITVLWDLSSLTAATGLTAQAVSQANADKGAQGIDLEAVKAIAKFVADKIPEQVKLVKKVKDGVAAYYKANDIPVPTDEDIEKKAKEREPKDAEDDEFARRSIFWKVKT